MNNNKYLNIKPLSISNLIVFFFTFSAFYYLNPYFTWPTFANGTFGFLFGSFPIRSVFAFISILCSLLYLWITPPKNQFLWPGLMVIAVFIILYIICNRGSIIFFDTTWIGFAAVALFVCLPSDIQIRIFNLFLNIFVITIIPSLFFYFIVELLGISIPYDVILPFETGKMNSGVYYAHRLFSVQFISPAVSNNRFSGIYYEAGVVGTMCAIFLTGRGYKFNRKDRWKDIILLICGILSFSVAFYLISVLFFLVESIINHNKKSILIIISLIIFYFIFVNIKFENNLISRLQSRLLISDGVLSGDNRSSKYYDRAFEKLFLMDLSTILFGMGKSAFATIQNIQGFDGSSYKSIIYDYGIIGFTSYVSWFVYTSFYAAKKYKLSFFVFLSLMVIQMGNIYQKPDIFPIYVIIPFIGGIRLKGESYFHEISSQRNSSNLQFKI